MEGRVRKARNKISKRKHFQIKKIEWKRRKKKGGNLTNKDEEVGVTQHKQLLVSYSADGRDVL